MDNKILLGSYDVLKQFILNNMICEVTITQPSNYKEIESYYCENDDDFNIVRQYENRKHDTQYHPYTGFNNEKFRGPDWYFFYFEDNSGYAPNSYWSETLSEKKGNFDNMCNKLNQIREESLKNKHNKGDIDDEAIL